MPDGGSECSVPGRAAAQSNSRERTGNCRQTGLCWASSSNATEISSPKVGLSYYNILSTTTAVAS